MESRMLKLAAGGTMLASSTPKLDRFSEENLQYNIPAVGHHYGNAFALDGEDEDDEESHDSPFTVLDTYGHSMNKASDTYREYYDDEEEEEEVDEDVELSPAIEIISIDPNCDYDSEEENVEAVDSIPQHHCRISDPQKIDDNVEIPDTDKLEVPKTDEEKQQHIGSWVADSAVMHSKNIAVVNTMLHNTEIDEIEQELENLHRDSEEENFDIDNRSGSRCSNSSSSSSSTSSSSCSSNSSSGNSIASRNSNNSNRSDASKARKRSASAASSHPSDLVHLSDREDADMKKTENLARIRERRKLVAIDRRKRTASTNRNSFSLPHSPVTVGGNNLLHEMTSLSFEDLDVSALVNNLSPLKSVARMNESDDKLVEELADVDFDLATYITEDDFLTTDSTNSSGQPDDIQHKRVQSTKLSPMKKHPRSRGKQLKLLRELMLSPKSDEHKSEATRRSCTNKARRIVESSDSESEDSPSETDSKTCSNIFGIVRSMGKTKRKDDDVKTDPTWNPNGTTPNLKPPQRTNPVQKQSISSQNDESAHHTSKPEINATQNISTTTPNASDNLKASSSSTNKNKLLNNNNSPYQHPGKGISMMAKGKLPTQPKKHTAISGAQPKSVGKDLGLHKKKLPTTSNVRLDHDYCSPKKGINQISLAPVPQRRAIEIPFLLPTLDQMRQKKKKLSKTKKQITDNKQVETGNDCDKKSQNVEISKPEVIENVDAKNTPVSPVQVSIKQENEEAVIIVAHQQAQVQSQPKQVSLLKVNQIKLDETQTPIDCFNRMEIPDVKPKIETLVNDAINNNNDCIVKVKKKLNLQEYKKRREFPADDVGVSLPEVESSSKCSISSLSTVDESSSKEEISRIVANGPNVKSPVRHATLLEGSNCLDKPPSKTPLDPISAAKLKALRMQQLKKQAAIKSTEPKIIPKTVPEILPLAEITSIKFDEHGNPLPYDKNEEKANSMKLHADYEEIIIVSVGCNTEIIINPSEVNLEIKKSSAEHYEMNIPENQLLSTIKKCQSSVPAIISSSSLISSIHEVVIRNKSSIKSEANDIVTTVTMDKRSVGGGEANQQGSPNIGVSPTNAFSPGKPEKAGGAYEQLPRVEYDEAQLKQPMEEGKPVEHGEDKIIMHLPKDRQRATGVTIGIQTLPLDRFPGLKLLSPIKKDRSVSLSRCGSAQRNHSRQSVEKNHERSRREYRRRHSGSSSSNSDVQTVLHRNRGAKRSSSRRSPSRCSSRRRSRSRSRSYRCRSRSDSRRRRSSISPDRRRYYDRDNARRGRRRQRSRSRSYCSSYSSRSRSRSRASRSRSRSISRPSSRVRNPTRSDYRRHGVSPERKIVYVGRLEPELKREDLKRKFIHYGRIKQVTLHYKESGAKYGFVTFDKPQDAYKAIDSSSKDPNLSEYDVSFGGRRAFCRTEYADLDGDLSHNQEAITYVAPDGSLVVPHNPLDALRRKGGGETFEDMLNKLKKEISAKKPRKS